MARRFYLGGVRIKDGYVMTWLKDNKDYCLHRLIMENHLGRELGVDEEVHHKNGDRSDNRLFNLRVLSRSEHMKLHRLEGNKKKERHGSWKPHVTERRINWLLGLFKYKYEVAEYLGINRSSLRHRINYYRGLNNG